MGQRWDGGGGKWLRRQRITHRTTIFFLLDFKNSKKKISPKRLVHLKHFPPSDFVWIKLLFLPLAFVKCACKIELSFLAVCRIRIAYSEFYK